MLTKFLILWFALAALSCSAPWNNVHNKVAVDCKISQPEAQKNFLQILDDTGQPLAPDQTSTLVAEFLDDAGRRMLPRITRGACIEIPDQAGQLAVVDSKSKAAVYWKTGNRAEAFPKRQLIKNPRFSFETLCQGENRFANNTLTRDWSLTTDGSLQNVRLQVQSRNIHDQQVTVLFTKGFGEELELPESWSIAQLREGQYQFEVLQQDLVDGLENAPRLVTFPAMCPLTVLHHPPTLVGLTDATMGVTVVDLDKGLEWKSSNENAELHVCMEEISEGTERHAPDLSCQASGSCKDRVNFKPTNRIRPDKEGLYKVFAFAKDRASNEGITQCRTAVFSSQAPLFDVRWKKDRWNRPGAVFDDPVPILKAQISGLFHQEISEANLKKNLECKVEAVLRSSETIVSSRLMCTEGRCKNQSLEVYRPCDSDLGIGIQDFWRSPYSNDAVLRLWVRIHDGAQHTREKVLPLTIHRSRWQHESMPWPGQQPLSVVKFWEDPLGNFIGFASNEMFSREAEVWKNVYPQRDGLPRSGNIFLTRDGSLYFISSGQEPETAVLRWVSGAWDPVPTPENFHVADEHDVFAHPLNGLWLRSSKISFRLSENTITRCAQLPGTFSGLTQFSADIHGKIWAFGQDKIFAQELDGAWEKIAVPRESSEMRHIYIVDRFAHIWKIVSDLSSAEESIKEIVRIDGGTIQSYPELVRLASAVSTDFTLDANFIPQLSNYIWSNDSQSWKVHPLLEGISDHVTGIRFWNTRDKVWYTRENRTYFEHEGELKYLPLYMSGDVPFITRSHQIWTYGFTSLNRYQPSAWTELNSELDDMENAIDIWQSPSKIHRLCTRSGKVWELQKGIWSLLVDLNVSSGESALSCFEDSQSNIFVRTHAATWVLPSGQKEAIRLSSAPQERAPEDFFEDSLRVVWFSCLDNQAAAAFCSFQNGQITFQTLPSEKFDEQDRNLCSFEIGRDLYFLGRNFAMVLRGTERIRSYLANNTIQFPDGTELSIENCLPMGRSSVLLVSDSRRSFSIFHQLDGTVKAVKEFDSDLNGTIRMVSSKDGHIYLSVDEAQSDSDDSVLSKKVKQGFIMRLEADGIVKQILEPKVRIQAFDDRTSIPQRFFADESGTLWSLSLDYSLWTNTTPRSFFSYPRTLDVVSYAGPFKKMSASMQIPATSDR
ncbi:MAG: hypothetical protein M3Q07_11855, partial [Pseudobdellovibrionaceae bacterium]|nr:hypothetical protein [Pseudobdellovibrionaceae bacterium]